MRCWRLSISYLYQLHFGRYSTDSMPPLALRLFQLAMNTSSAFRLLQWIFRSMTLFSTTSKGCGKRSWVVTTENSLFSRTGKFTMMTNEYISLLLRYPPMRQTLNDFKITVGAWVHLGHILKLWTAKRIFKPCAYHSAITRRADVNRDRVRWPVVSFSCILA